jgi:hypothetical protein
MKWTSITFNPSRLGGLFVIGKQKLKTLESKAAGALIFNTFLVFPATGPKRVQSS